ncbi:MAG TPA: MFS transporter [Terracidiphilus sp.]|jgi:fucose permease|nr:MFS transporter [Terracidiphilus sp.]
MQSRLLNSSSAPARQTLSSAVLSFGFGLTGAGIVMLGVLLPILAQRWTLNDEAAGVLLFLQFFGSSLGAIFTTLHRVHSLIRGYALLVLSMAVIAFSGAHAPFAAFFFYGLGLGMVMTATSLLITDRSQDESAAKLEALNFIWSVGAMAGPLLFLPFLHQADVRTLFFFLLALFLLLLAWVVFAERRPSPGIEPHAPRAAAPGAFAALLPLVILAMCAVGVEAALSGWLTTYSHRAGLHSLAGAALATSLFWLGEMLSRLAFSTRLLAAIGRRATLYATVCGALVTVCALIAAPYPWAILVLSAAAGICIGPLYPLLLSFMLERSARGWIFAVGGIGAALFPWLTGALSSHLGSLRYGLVAPCSAALIMAVVIVWMRFAAMRRAAAPQPDTPAHS